MKNYFVRMQEEKTPHQRRQWALRAAGALTAVVFLGWAGTLGLRFAAPGSNTNVVAQNDGFDIQSQLASVFSGIFPAKQTHNTLEVATTSSQYGMTSNSYGR